MSDEYYEQLAQQLDSLPNAFPRTKSGSEIRLLKKIVKPEEAKLASLLTKELEPIEAVAEKFGLSVQATARRLQALMLRGLVWQRQKEGVPGYRLAPFVVGLYEAQLKNMDHELAHLFDAYMMEAGAQGILELEPALHRVVPVRSAMKTEEILPYDDVRALLMKAKAFSLRDCICRIERSYHGFQCKYPVRICLSFSMVDRPPMPTDVSQAEALAALEEADEVGLVHTVTNVMEGWSYVCNCCGCCCALLRGITEFGIEQSVARSNYFAEVETDGCSNCGLCYDRCHVAAIAENQEGMAAVNTAKCIGCGLCVRACPDRLIHLHRKPEADTVHPPATFEDWERARLANRAQAK